MFKDTVGMREGVRKNRIRLNRLKRRDVIRRESKVGRAKDFISSLVSFDKIDSWVNHPAAGINKKNRMIKVRRLSRGRMSTVGKERFFDKYFTV